MQHRHRRLFRRGTPERHRSAEVFSVASRLAGTGSPGYRVEVATAKGGVVRTSSGVRLVADRLLAELDGQLDIVLVSGAIELLGHGGAVAEPVIDTEVVDWLRSVAPRARRIGSVCAGAHLLA
ncbi:DJ-1/PfpI family protein [Streptomyces sp. SAS_267]|jgi:transcriptional regulator GlxA family with amidase domain|uniref:DJ-1/PfpI family protein n=1 Tax=unclassified Streptomyces TaxID=2593676 RepID=UPI0036FBD4E7